MITKKSLQNLNGLLMLSAIAKYQSKRKVAEVTNSSIRSTNIFPIWNRFWGCSWWSTMPREHI